jgi:hypothetical protein
MGNTHKWSFSSVGGVKRVNFESGKDILELEHLDQKLWGALSCPVYGLELDSKTLELIDEDKDGQIRASEIIKATKWIGSIIKNTDDLLKEEAKFNLDAINDSSHLGKVLLASAKTILKNIGKESEAFLTVEDTSDVSKIFANTRFNGDGVITADSCAEEELKEVLNEIVSCVGGVNDRNGKTGTNTELLTLFINACNDYSAWYLEAENNKESYFPFNENTEKAYSAYLAIKAKVEDYFLRCKMAAFDKDSVAALNVLGARIESISDKNLGACLDEIALFPFAKIHDQQTLPLRKGINPALENLVAEFRTQVSDILYPGKDELTEKEWQAIAQKFVAYEKWLSDKKGDAVESLGLQRVRAILAQDVAPKLFELIEKDKSYEEEANNIFLVDKLVRYHRDLFTLIKNYVTFYDFYSPVSSAAFQAGTLYIDQRSCDLCIKVNDMPKHESISNYSGMFLLYCKCVRKSDAKSMIIVAAVTSGDIDNLEVGRNAIFYDRNGDDYDATVIKIVENPISIRQSFWSPYRKVSRFIEKQVNKFATEQDNKATADLTGKVEAVPAKVASTQPAVPPTPFDVGKFVGIFAAIGLALGAIGSVLAAVISGFLDLAWWKIPFAILGLLLLISGPSMIIAFLKLRKRNLAPILDANGWAINARVVVNIPFGNTLTHLAIIPFGAKLNLNDPFAEKGRPWWQWALVLGVIAAVVLLAAWKYGWI